MAATVKKEKANMNDAMKDSTKWQESDRVSIAGPRWSGLYQGRVPKVVANDESGVTIQLHPDVEATKYPHTVAEIRFVWLRKESDFDVSSWRCN